MKRVFFYGMAIFMAFALNGCGDNGNKSKSAPLSANIQRNWGSAFGVMADWKELRITSKADGLLIKDVKVNRGNCKFSNTYYSPGKTKLNFGQTSYIGNLSSGCNVMEVQVITNQGTWTLYFN